jgi:hypothetical protein
MKKHILGFLLPVAGIFAIASPVSALTESFNSSPSTYSLNPSASTQQSSTGVTLQQFNPSLGTLSSINLTFTGTTTFVIDGYNFTSSDQTGNLTSASQTLYVALASGPDSQNYLVTGTSTSGAATPDIPVGTFGSQVGSSLAGSPFSLSQTTTFFSDFTGTGTVGLNILADQPNLQTPQTTNYSLVPDSSTIANGSLSVTYTYTAPVPFDISANEVVFYLVPLFLGMRVIKKRWQNNKL